jgi:hypothetical protein
MKPSLLAGLAATLFMAVHGVAIATPGPTSTSPGPMSFRAALPTDLTSIVNDSARTYNIDTGTQHAVTADLGTVSNLASGTYTYTVSLLNNGGSLTCYYTFNNLADNTYQQTSQTTSVTGFTTMTLSVTFSNGGVSTNHYASALYCILPPYVSGTGYAAVLGAF